MELNGNVDEAGDVVSNMQPTQKLRSSLHFVVSCDEPTALCLYHESHYNSRAVVQFCCYNVNACATCIMVGYVTFHEPRKPSLVQMQYKVHTVLLKFWHLLFFGTLRAKFKSSLQFSARNLNFFRRLYFQLKNFGTRQTRGVDT